MEAIEFGNLREFNTYTRDEQHYIVSNIDDVAGQRFDFLTQVILVGDVEFIQILAGRGIKFDREVFSFAVKHKASEQMMDLLLGARSQADADDDAYLDDALDEAEHGWQVRFLLDHGAVPTHRPHQFSMLHSTKDVESIKLLEPYNVAKYDVEPPFMQNFCVEGFKYLFRGYTPTQEILDDMLIGLVRLNRQCVPDFEGMLQCYLAVGANINATDDRGRTAIFYCHSVNHAQTLANYGAALNVTDKKLRTPLHVTQDAATCDYFIQQGADVNAIDVLGNTPLFYLLHPRRLVVLIKNGADIDITNKKGISFANNGMIQIIKDN